MSIPEIVPYCPEQDIYAQLNRQSKWNSSDEEVTAYKPLEILGRPVEIVHHKTTGMMSEYDARLLDDVQMRFKIYSERVLITECSPSELNAKIKEIFSGKISLPN